MSRLEDLTPARFEDLVRRIFDLDGYATVRADAAELEKTRGIWPDLVVEDPRSGERIAIEVQQTHRLDRRALAATVLYKNSLRLARAFLIAPAPSVPEPFRDLARSVGVDVMGLDWLRTRIEEHPALRRHFGEVGEDDIGPATLRVERLELADFKGFAHLDLPLDPSVTLLIGRNSAGKSTILDAIARALSWLHHRIEQPRDRGVGITEDDVRAEGEAATIRLTARLSGRLVRWQLASPGRRPDYSDLKAPIERLRARLDADPDAPLPIAVHYPVDRSSGTVPRRIRKKHRFERMDAMQGALAGGNRDFRLFFEWFRLREDLENEQRRDDDGWRDPQLVAVRRAIEAMMPGYEDLRIRRNPQRMMLRKNDTELRVDALSDGERALLTLVGDLARRLAIANPAGDALNGSGVVLIDEVALHLHPGWQRRIVPDLRRIFPSIQFIVTTHTPLVLGSVDRDCVVMLEDFRPVPRTPHTQGRDANAILYELMGVPRYPAETRALIDDIEAALDAERWEDARGALTRLTERLGEDDETVAYHRSYLETLAD